MPDKKRPDKKRYVSDPDRICAGTRGSGYLHDAVGYEAVERQHLMWARWMQSSATSTTTSATGWAIDDSSTSITFPVTFGNTCSANLVWGSTAWMLTEHRRHQHHVEVVREKTPAQLAQIAVDIAAATERRQEAARLEAQRQQFRLVSNGRARNLLNQMLSPAQRLMLETKSYFELTVHDRDGASRTYRIEHGYAGNVKLLDAKGVPVRRYCIHADSRLPYEDQMLAQKLLLESNEMEFLKIANKTELQRPHQQAA